VLVSGESPPAPGAAAAHGVSVPSPGPLPARRLPGQRSPRRPRLPAAARPPASFGHGANMFGRISPGSHPGLVPGIGSKKRVLWEGTRWVVTFRRLTGDAGMLLPPGCWGWPHAGPHGHPVLALSPACVTGSSGFNQPWGRCPIFQPHISPQTPLTAPSPGPCCLHSASASRSLWDGGGPRHPAVVSLSTGSASRVEEPKGHVCEVPPLAGCPGLGGHLPPAPQHKTPSTAAPQGPQTYPGPQAQPEPHCCNGASTSGKHIWNRASPSLVSPSVTSDTARPKGHRSRVVPRSWSSKSPRATDPLHKLQNVLGPREQLV